MDKELIETIHNENGDGRVKSKSLFILISALGGYHVWAAQCCANAEEVLEELTQRYNSDTVMRRLGAPTNLLSTWYKQNIDMAEHILQMESKFALLAAMGSEIDEPMDVPLLLSPIKE